MSVGREGAKAQGDVRWVLVKDVCIGRFSATDHIDISSFKGERAHSPSLAALIGRVSLCLLCETFQLPCIELYIE